MESIALYRKYRPKNFKEILGQDHVVKVLRGALKEKHSAHAYLFAGTRGTGKTSIARILARELGTSEKDLYEIDAASNRGIDDVRELREAARAMPFDSSHKVYIVDEVHMLTKEAFNALLKTLEEPPEHVIFILATTELDRVPDTIISRCEVHHFKKPSRHVLREDIIAIAKKEGFTLESAVGDHIALLAEGSFRDAQGILQKILNASSDKKVSMDEVETVTGAPRMELVWKVVDAFDTQDAEAGLSVLGEAVEAGVDMKVFSKLLLHSLRAVLLAKHAQGLKGELQEEFGEEDMARIEALVAKDIMGITFEVLEVVIDAYNRTGHTALPQLPLELAVMKIAASGEETLFS